MRQLTDERRQSDPDRLEDDAGASWGFGAEHEALVCLIDGDLFDPIEIAHDVAPLEIDPGGGKAIVELLAQHKAEEGAKQVTDNGRIGLVMDRPSLEDRLGGSEDRFHFP